MAALTARRDHLSDRGRVRGREMGTARHPQQVRARHPGSVAAPRGKAVLQLSVGLFTIMQRHTPLRLQGRVNGRARCCSSPRRRRRSRPGGADRSGQLPADAAGGRGGYRRLRRVAARAPRASAGGGRSRGGGAGLALTPGWRSLCVAAGLAAWPLSADLRTPSRVLPGEYHPEVRRDAPGTTQLSRERR